MAIADYDFLQVRPKTKEVVEFHNDDSRPGKPLRVMVPGALLAIASLGTIIYIVYKTWLKTALAEDQAVRYLVWLAPVYIFGVFLFSYGLEIYNLPKALKLTAIIVFTTVFIVLVIAVLFLLASAKVKSGSSGGSSSKSSSSSSSKSLSSGSGGGFGGLRRIVPIVGSSGNAGVEEKAVSEASPPLQSVVCPNCSRSYVPATNSVACPYCGAGR